MSLLKKANTFLTHICTHPRLPKPVTALFLATASATADAQTGGLTRARTALEKFRDNITLIIPIVAIIACALIGLLYAADMIRKETMWNWMVGIVIAGSAAELVALLFG